MFSWLNFGRYIYIYSGIHPFFRDFEIYIFILKNKVPHYLLHFFGIYCRIFLFNSNVIHLNLFWLVCLENCQSSLFHNNQLFVWVYLLNFWSLLHYFMPWLIIMSYSLLLLVLACIYFVFMILGFIIKFIFHLKFLWPLNLNFYPCKYIYFILFCIYFSSINAYTQVFWPNITSLILLQLQLKIFSSQLIYLLFLWLHF